LAGSGGLRSIGKVGAAGLAWPVDPATNRLAVQIRIALITRCPNLADPIFIAVPSPLPESPRQDLTGETANYITECNQDSKLATANKELSRIS